MTIEQRKQLDDLICDEVNIKAFNRILGESEQGKIELQYVRSLRRYNWRVNGTWRKNAEDDVVNKLLTHPKCTGCST